MPSWFPLLFLLLACPLMMIFMMRGAHGGHDDATAHTSGHPHEEAVSGSESPNARDERLAELEREVAELRAARSNTDVSKR